MDYHRLPEGAHDEGGAHNVILNEVATKPWSVAFNSRIKRSVTAYTYEQTWICRSHCGSSSSKHHSSSFINSAILHLLVPTPFSVLRRATCPRAAAPFEVLGNPGVTTSPSHQGPAVWGCPFEKWKIYLGNMGRSWKWLWVKPWYLVNFKIAGK